mmetsp:Transcript_33094/g.65667  ORF Transcript_33094/g.65667 Transcript_33094/m.65667 type:complete len:212 (+) Transcript_33094:2213-2848(+)
MCSLDDFRRVCCNDHQAACSCPCPEILFPWGLCLHRTQQREILDGSGETASLWVWRNLGAQGGEREGRVHAVHDHDFPVGQILRRRVDGRKQKVLSPQPRKVGGNKVLHAGGEDHDGSSVGLGSDLVPKVNSLRRLHCPIGADPVHHHVHNIDHAPQLLLHFLNSIVVVFASVESRQSRGQTSSFARSLLLSLLFLQLYQQASDCRHCRTH